MAGTGTGAKTYVVKLCAEERERLEAMIKSGKRSAQLITKARILLKADTSDAGEGWTDGEIAAALDTSVNTVGSARRQLVEEGFEATLVRKYNPNSARPRIFDGATEAKLIALACSPAPEGFARWSTVARREGRRIEHRREGERQHDRTDFKKTLSNPIAIGNGSFHPTPTRPLSRRWKTCWKPTKSRVISIAPSFVWTKLRNS